jgi:hypothetical protein
MKKILRNDFVGRTAGRQHAKIKPPALTGSRIVRCKHTIANKLRSKQISRIVEYSKNVISVDSAWINPGGKNR